MMLLAHGALGICPLELMMVVSSLPLVGVMVRRVLAWFR
jgi:hypothetical protein